MASSSKIGCSGLPRDTVEYASRTDKSTVQLPKPGQTRRCFVPTVFELCCRIFSHKVLENQLVLKLSCTYQRVTLVSRTHKPISSLTLPVNYFLNWIENCVWRNCSKFQGACFILVHIKTLWLLLLGNSKFPLLFIMKRNVYQLIIIIIKISNVKHRYLEELTTLFWKLPWRAMFWHNTFEIMQDLIKFLNGFVDMTFVPASRHLSFQIRCFKYVRPSCLGSPCNLFQITVYSVIVFACALESLTCKSFCRLHISFNRPRHILIAD